MEDALSSFREGNLKEQNAKPAKITNEAQGCLLELHNEFHSKMSDDMNTAHILTGAFREALKFANNSLKKLKNAKQQQLSHVQYLVEIEKEVKEVLKILGLLPPCTYDEALQQLEDKALKRSVWGEGDLLNVIKERTEARKNKDFARTDQIRAELEAKGIALMDIGTETIWRPCIPTEYKQEAPPAEQEQKVPTPSKQKQEVPHKSIY